MEPNVAKARTPAALLEMALTKEKSSCAFYEQVLKHASAGLLQEMVETLKGEEWKHVRMIERKLKELHDGRL
jgi:rubrerythrin